MNWQRPKHGSPSSDFHVTCGRWTICKARVGEGWKYTLSEGNTLVVTGTLDECKAEALRLDKRAA